MVLEIGILFLIFSYSIFHLYRGIRKKKCNGCPKEKTCKGQGCISLDDYFKQGA